jgi:hypothetical protein
MKPGSSLNLIFFKYPPHIGLVCQKNVIKIGE